MKVITLSVAGTAQLVERMRVRTKVYMIVAGPGTVRWGTDKTSLEQGPAPGVNFGLPQTAGQGEKEREWIGDLYAVSDTPGTNIITVCPQNDHNARLGPSGPQGTTS